MDLKPYLWIFAAIAFLIFLTIESGEGINYLIYNPDEILWSFALFAGLSLLVGWIRNKISKTEE